MPNDRTKLAYEFGPFRLEPEERLLLRDGVPVAITPKAFDTLLALVRHSGHLLSKDELMREVWPDSFVEENYLSVNISKLRAVLGDAGRKTRPWSVSQGRAPNTMTHTCSSLKLTRSSMACAPTLAFKTCCAASAYSRIESMNRGGTPPCYKTPQSM